MQTYITHAFRQRFGIPPEIIVRAPGRVNLIGEHTDYNDGFVLPLAIDRAIWIALNPRMDRRVYVHSLDFNHPVEFHLNNLSHQEGWGEYVTGMAWALQKAGYILNGWEGVLAGDVPVGAGLSSSAALELAVARAFYAVSIWDWNGVEIAKLAQLNENEWLGVKTGIMDQMISANGQAGNALLIDCRSLELTPVKLPAKTGVVILDTSTRRGLVDSTYNERVAQCQAAAQFFGVKALRDVSWELFQTTGRGLSNLPYHRARHVITENKRTLEAVAAMKAEDASMLGDLMNASHESLRDDYEVSSDALNIMVSIAQAQNGCLGARMTGAGFGGCAVALVVQEKVHDFAVQTAASYKIKTGLNPHVYICEAANGAETVYNRLRT